MTRPSPGETGARPLVSVIIPAFNAAPFVTRAIESALRQSYREFEILVVDDGSSDGTAEVVARLGGAVRLLRVPHGGLSWARNHGMRAARGRYLAFLDADDCMEETLLARALAILQANESLGFVFCNGHYFGPFDDGRTRLVPAGAFAGRPVAIVDDAMRQVLGAGYMLSSSGLCAPRATLLEAGFFDEELKSAEDFEYWSRIHLRRPIAYLAEPLVRIYRGPDNMTRQSGRMIDAVAVAAVKVTLHCRAAGRGDLEPVVRDYARRAIGTGLRDLLLRGEGREAARLFLRHRGRYMSPAWWVTLPAALCPGFVLRGAAGIGRWWARAIRRRA